MGTGKNEEPTPVDRVCCHSPLDDRNAHLVPYLRPDFFLDEISWHLQVGYKFQVKKVWRVILWWPSCL